MCGAASFSHFSASTAPEEQTISIMCGQLKADSGSVIISGHDADRDIAQITRKLGVVFQSSVLDKPLSVRDNLESRAALYGITGAEFEKGSVSCASFLSFPSFLTAASASSPAVSAAG